MYEPLKMQIVVLEPKDVITLSDGVVVDGTWSFIFVED